MNLKHQIISHIHDLDLSALSIDTQKMLQDYLLTVFIPVHFEEPRRSAVCY